MTASPLERGGSVPLGPADDGARYAAAVREALADLPAEERDELLDDLEGHLAEVAAEDGGSLARLGTPQVFAAELRLSAGLPAPARGRVGLDELVARTRAAVVGLQAHRAGQEAVALARELRPAWWLARAGAAFVLGAALSPHGGLSVTRAVPRLLDSPRLGLLLLLAMVVVSVRLGRREAALPAPRLALVRAGDALAVLVLLGLAARLLGGGYGYDSVSSDSYSGPVSYLEGPGGPVSNIYAYDALGRPLKDVQLYDQDGAPLAVLQRSAPDGSYAEPQPRTDTSGAPVSNVFPRSYRIDGADPGTGVPTTLPVPPPSITAPRIVPAPSPATATATPR